MNNKSQHVIFGTGPLGMSVMRELIARGKVVRMVNRSGHAEVPADVEVVKADAYNLDQTREVCRDASVVYQCAQPAYTEWQEKFPPLQACILEGAASAGAKLIVGENLYMYGEVDAPMTEDMPNHAHTRKGRVRAAMSESLLEAHRNGKVRAALGRASDFYGPGVLDSAMGDMVFYPALAGKQASGIGNIDLLHTYTYISDFGTALVNLGERDNALGQIWHVPNAPTITTRQFITMIYEELGLTPKVGKIGRLMMMIGGMFIPVAREMLEMGYEFEKPFIVDNSKYNRVFGDHSTPIREGIRQTIAWFRAHPKQDHKAA